MKFNKIGVAMLATGLMLTGCSTSSPKTVDGQDVVVSITDKNIFADDILTNMLIQYSGTNTFFEGIMSQVITDAVPVSSAMEIDADTVIDSIRTAYDANYGKTADDELNSALQYSGFNSLEEYRMSLIESLQYTTFLDLYIKENMDEVFEDYFTYMNPKNISLIKVSVSDTTSLTEDEEELIEELKEKIASTDDFGSLVYDYSSDSNTSRNQGRLGIIDTTTSTDTYGEDFMDAALALSHEEVTEEPIESNGALYFIKCNSANADELKEMLYEMGTESPLISYDPYLLYIIFEKYDVEYYDDAVKALVEDVVSTQLEKRQEIREENNDE